MARCPATLALTRWYDASTGPNAPASHHQGLSDPEGAGGFVDPSWLSYSEVIHGRWAMLGAAGCIAPEVLSSAGAIPQATEDVIWFRSGVIPPAGTYETGYWTDPYSLFFVEIILMQFAELKRLQDYRFPGSQGKQYFLGLEAAFNGSGNPAYPGARRRWQDDG